MYNTKKYVILNYAMSWGLFALMIVAALLGNCTSILEGDSIIRIFILQAAVCILSAFFAGLVDGTDLIASFGIPQEGILVSALYCLFTGATGEESGWRGFLLKGYLQKHNLLISSIFTGVVWAFWHLPVWILSGYTGTYLIKYISAFSVCTIAFTVIMMYYYDKSRNIVVLVFFHYMINFVLSFYHGNDLLYQMFTAGIYAVTTMVIVLTNKKLYLIKGISLEG